MAKKSLSLTPVVRLFISLFLSLISSLQAAWSQQQYPNPELSSRFVKIDNNGNALKEQNKSYSELPWACVFDRQTQLLWEVKTPTGARDTKHTYSWYQSDNRNNGGFSGYTNGGQCGDSNCDTTQYTDMVRQLQLCQQRQWRLPNREELRSIVDYSIVFPGPTINRHYFPNTTAQFYWSSSADASDTDSAWGIGFTFGFDYSYFKSDPGHIRLVSGTR